MSVADRAERPLREWRLRRHTHLVWSDRTQSHDLQELAKTYYQVSRARTKVQHSLINHGLTLYFPEMHRYWCTTRNDWFVRFLLQFPTPAHVRSLSCAEFVDAAWDVVGRKVNKRAKLEEIWEMAGATAALPHAPDSLAVETFRITLRRYQQLNALRAELEVRAEQALASNEDFAHLKTLPGIGSVIAMRYAALKERAQGLPPRNIDPTKLAARTLLMLVNQ